MTNKNNYSIEELSQLLNISQKQIRRKIASGVLETSKEKGKYAIAKKNLKELELIIKNDNVEYDMFGNESTIKQRKKGKEKNGKLPDAVNWKEISDLWENPGDTIITAVDLFCGAGGISKGFELAGIKCICGLDWYEPAGKTYRYNFNHEFIEGDIRDETIKSKFYESIKANLNGRTLNIVAGGFPCQGFSMSGHRIVSDERNILYREMMEIISELSPEFVLMENVVGLRTMLKGKIEEKIIEDLNNAGYSVNVTTLCAADYYVPQKRNRVIFIANRLGLKNYHPLPILTEEAYITTNMSINDLMSIDSNTEFNHVPTNHSDEMKIRLQNVMEGESLYDNYSDAWKKCPWNEASCTIKENHGGVNIHPILPRVLTAREMARLQSFPDDFLFKGSKSQQLVQIGNAVPPLLAKAIGLALRKTINQSK